MGRRWQRLVGEASRFLAVGGVATVVALFLFNLLVHGFWVFDRPPLNNHPLWAYVAANSVGMVVSYRGTRSWAFKHREPVHADGGRTAFVAINLVTMTLPIACLWLSRSALGLDGPLADNVAANVVGLGLGTAARFWLFRALVFRRPAGVGEVSASRGRSTSGPAPPGAP